VNEHPLPAQPFTVARRDGSTRLCRLYPPGAFTRLLRAEPITASALLTRLRTSEIRVMARACRQLAAWRPGSVAPIERWWESVIGRDGPQPKPTPGPDATD
jgi:hypothetical protein